MKMYFGGLIVILCGSLCLAGSLQPSAAPAPTMKTLNEIEPRIPIPASTSAASTFIISTSGSYYLQGERLCSTIGIRVDVNNVTIDLCGYSLVGNGSYTGISIMGRNNVEIRNGTIRNFAVGIEEPYTAGTSHRIIDIRAIANARAGIYLSGSNNQVRGCSISGNGFSPAGNPVYGIFPGTNSTVAGNNISNNGKSASVYVYSVFCGSNCTITNNTITDNGISSSSNVYGLLCDSGCTVVGNTICNNGTSGTSPNIYGIYFWSGSCLVDQNTVNNNNGTNMNRPASNTFGLNQAP
jgi:hypothetical protein